ncbi:hypothetical protein [Christiangramia sp. OXR-203]|uniref:lipopolysaccharide biosynthesis protein n=1 Tax=Christiangramia sp. OXR-203 TaxID=3100176 RepID=UPI002AC97811|nr:hypothetical protein [Christiangramia sp. OXR-203]WPY98256.1 hypothetical protein T8I65_13880 [Christiangramia sp. OXR-203]
MKAALSNINKGFLISTKFGHLINQILYSAFSFGVSFIAARLLTVGLFGEFSYAISLFPLLGIVPLSFIHFPFMNFYSKWGKKKNEFYTGNLIIATVLIFIISLFLIGILILTNTLKEYLPLIFTYFFLYQIYDFQRKVNLTISNILLLNITELSRVTLLLVGLIILNYMNMFTLNFFLITLVLVLITSLLIPVCFSKKHEFNFEKLAFAKIYKESFQFGKFIFLSNVVQNISANLFLYISVFLLSTDSIARLNAPKIILGVSSIFLLSMDNFYTPKIAERINGNKRDISHEVFKIFRDIKIFYIILVIGCIFLITIQDFIIQILFGAKYAQGENFLWGFIVVGLLYSFSRPFLIVIRVFERTKFLFISSLYILIFTMLLTYPLMHYFGALGGILTMILSALFQLSIFIFDFKRNA